MEKVTNRERAILICLLDNEWHETRDLKEKIWSQCSIFTKLFPDINKDLEPSNRGRKKGKGKDIDSIFSYAKKSLLRQGFINEKEVQSQRNIKPNAFRLNPEKFFDILCILKNEQEEEPALFT
jgi:hypothetical protein